MNPGGGSLPGPVLGSSGSAAFLRTGEEAWRFRAIFKGQSAARSSPRIKLSSLERLQTFIWHRLPPLPHLVASPIRITCLTREVFVFLSPDYRQPLGSLLCACIWPCDFTAISDSVLQTWSSPPFAPCALVVMHHAVCRRPATFPTWRWAPTGLPHLLLRRCAIGAGSLAAERGGGPPDEAARPHLTGCTGARKGQSAQPQGTGVWLASHWF